ncbi:MAG: OmpA family protein [Prevotella sp.]|nr:OmpA family protein [Prevotella sp.]MDY4039404.1 OmpA family protein [Prevotella sp.]
MKKLLFMFAAAAMTMSANAQTVTESKSFDNFYIGINGGVASKTTGVNGWLGHLNPNAGLRIGRYFTPVFGLAVESSAYFSNKPYASFGTAVRALNTSLLGTVNLSNWFGGYKGEPRAFEVVGLYGFGWGHTFGSQTVELNNDGSLAAPYGKTLNGLTSKAGIDFVFNLGSSKAWQLYVEPAIVWGLNGSGYEGVAYNLNKSAVQLNAGVVYKFRNSNGTHNFTIAQLRDQAEIDGLNAQVNSLRNNLNDKDAQLAQKDRKIADLQDALDECNKKPKYVKPATATNLQPTVLFRLGSSQIDRAQLPNVELIANYMKNHKDAKVTIKGYASPEGDKQLNQRLSENRANAVKNMLVSKYKISADRLTAIGMGVTDKLFSEIDFNRVATFNDDTNND